MYDFHIGIDIVGNTANTHCFTFFLVVCEAGCDWEGSLSREDFLNVSHGMIQKQINRVDDVKAAFR